MVRAIVDLDDCPRSVETIGHARRPADSGGVRSARAAADWMRRRRFLVDGLSVHTGRPTSRSSIFAPATGSPDTTPTVGGFLVMRPLFYPFPSLFVLAPFALIPLRAAMALFVGCSTALLAWGILAKSPERLPMLLGAGFIVASGLGQWTPLVTATLLIPALGFLAVVKPNVGLASVADDPSAIRILGGGALLLISLAFQPSWPAEWLANLRSMPPHPSPILLPGGFLALLALARWRRPEARLLVAMACVPQLHVLRRPAPALARGEDSARIDPAQRDEPRRVGDLTTSAQPPQRNARIRVKRPRSSRSLRAGARHGAQTAQRGHDSIVSRTTHRTLAEVDQR